MKTMSVGAADALRGEPKTASAVTMIKPNNIRVQDGFIIAAPKT
jgi:hypothetical protein